MTPDGESQYALSNADLEGKTPEEIYKIGANLFEEDKYDEAIAVLQQSDLTNLSVQYVLGSCYLEIDKYPTALRYFENIIKANPNRIEITVVLNQCAICSMQEKDFAKAIEYLEKAKKLNENDIQTLTNYGVCLYEIKDYRKALKSLEKALKVKSKVPNALAKQYLRKLDVIGFKHTPHIPSSTLTLSSIGG